MGNVRVIPRSLTDAYKRREGDFAPNLVGLQFTNGVSLFTFGNFEITTNLDSRLNVNFTLGGQWSDYYSLDNLNLSQTESNILLSNDLFVRLNFNPFNINRYVYFGSFYEFTRVTIENIIQNWKGSVYLDPYFNTNTVVNTVLSFNYDSGNDVANFLIPKSTIINNFQLNVDYNINFDIPVNEIYNLSRDYNKYVIWNVETNSEIPVIGYTGSTDAYQYISIQTKGNPFPSLTASTFGQIIYHLKPNATEVQLFFEQLSDFEKVLLNRLVSPIYTAQFDVPRESDGTFYYTSESFTWPVSDGYNLDINSRDYANYVQTILDATNSFDKYKTDLISRRFVSESIHEFDTNGGTATTTGDEIYGMKVSKLLRIYGREYDEVKKYIDGISFANVVTYNKLDNTSDELIKMMAKTLGFDVLLTVTTDNFNLLEQTKPSFKTSFSGYSRSLSAKELDVELWRRLVINAWWLWKSKGTRKVIEFFFSLFNIPGCMITLDEYVYLAENRLNVNQTYDQLVKIFEVSGLADQTVSLSNYPMDAYGFPRVLSENLDNYFQMDGFWYNGGNNSTVGNNPHNGPYDFGRSYFSQFECFVPNFAQLLTGSTLITVNENYFNNYNEGTFIYDQNGLPVPYYGTGYANVLNNGLVNNAVVNSAGLTYVGGNNAPNYSVPSGDTYSMKISFTAGNKNVCNPCTYQLTYGPDGVVYTDVNNTIPLDNQNCCQNYWLPTMVNPPVCPDASMLVITIDDVVQYNGTTISQDCCSKTILGFDVSWDGTNCVITKTGGLGTGGLGTGGLGTGGLGTTTIRTYSAGQLFQSSISQPTNTVPSYLCYWCPPQSTIQTICSVDDYLATLTNTQINQLAISLGWSETTVGTQQQFISNIYTPFFNTYGCLLLDSNDQEIGNQACCELRGGTWTSIGTGYKCIVPTTNPCGTPQVSPDTHVWVNTVNNTLISESCCNQTGQYWVSPLSNGDNIILTTTSGPETFLDIPGSTFAGQTSYCSACPNNLIEVVASTGIFIVDSNNNMLSQQCCIDYGFTWSPDTNQCSKCPTVVNYGTPLDDTVITNLNGDDLTQQCCQAVGGWYGNAFNEGNRCYICPGVMIYDGSGSPTSGIPNPDYIYVGNEITYQGNSLSQACCTQYNAAFGGVTWDSVENKCLNYNMGSGGGALNSQGFEIIIGDASCGSITTTATKTHNAWIKQFSSIPPDSLPGNAITVYVPIGQTPINSTLYLDPNLSIVLSPSNKGFASPTGNWYISFRYNNDIYLLNYGTITWSPSTGPFPTAVYKGAVGSPCTGTFN